LQDYFVNLSIEDNIMRTLLSALSILIVFLSGAQTNRYYQPGSSTYTPQFVPVDYTQLQKTLEQRQSLYDKNRAHTDYLLDWILDAKLNTDEEQFLSDLDRYYKILRTLDGKDFSKASYALRVITLEIKETTYEYNKRMKKNKENKEKRELSTHNENVGNYKFIATFDGTFNGLPLREHPDPYSKDIYLCPDDAVIYVIEESGDSYFKVHVNGHTGYLSKLFIKKKY